MPEPTDKKLYKQVKKHVYKNIPKHSAYRSGIVVQKYKKSFKKKHGNKNPYKGNKTRKRGLKRWFAEKWVNQRGKVGYKYKSDIYRPSKRITKDTPITHNEISKRELKRARSEKKRTGRVRKFKKQKTKKMKGGKNSRNKTKKIINKKNKMTPKKGKKVNGKIFFKDYPEFKPNLTPREIFKSGSFGGTYWRPIKSKFFSTELRNAHKQFPNSWWKGIQDEHLTRPFDKYDKSINKYGVKVGTTLAFWESKNWIKKSHPYGWVEWYCDFYMGKRGDDDERQIKRWQGVAGQRGRFMRFLVTQILKKNGTWNDENVSPKIRQTLQHWAYKLTKSDFNHEVKRRKK